MGEIQLRNLIIKIRLKDNHEFIPESIFEKIESISFIEIIKIKTIVKNNDIPSKMIKDEELIICPPHTIP